MSNEITYFNSFISQRFTGIPYSTQWMVHIDSIPNILANNLKDVDTQTWNINRTGNALRQINASNYNTVQGNIFAQAVSVPGEKVNYSRVGMEADYRGGFMQAPIVSSRADNEAITIDFLETRDSFVDLVIRPWVIQVGFKGLIPPRDANDTIKTDLWAIFFDRGDSNNPDKAPVIRKKWIFHNAVPISVDPDTVDYQKNQITVLKTQWLYTHYTVEAANDQPPTSTQNSNFNQLGAAKIPSFNTSIDKSSFSI